MEASSGAVPMETYEKLATKYNELHKLFRDLKEEHAKCHEWNEMYHAKYKSMKANQTEWQIYIDKHREKHGTSDAATSPRKDRAAVEKRSSPRVTSSQTTEGEQESSPPTTHDPASDNEPEIISTRSLKRKRSVSNRVKESPVQIKQEVANSPENPVRLLSDDYSSPMTKRQGPTRRETSDLDAFVQRMDTPRKRRRQRCGSEEVKRPAPLPLNVSSLSDGDLPGAQQVLDCGEEAGSDSMHEDPTVAARDFAKHSGANVEGGNALRPRSVNIPSNSSAASSRQLANAKRKRDERHKILILSEDGDNYNTRVAAPGSHARLGDSVRRRLDTLLEEPTPGKQALSKRRSLASTTPRPREQRASPTPKQAKVTPEERVPFEYRTPLGLEPAPPHALPEDEPLRSRPWQSLGLSDFKINPKFMGSDFAFSETFRGREQRRCLPGCTKPDCCGNAFRKAIEMGAVQTNKTDAEVLEEYLGRNFNQIVAAYSPDKRKDLIIQARAYALANQHGKHRQAYERPRTPPGFWRTDMPNTQEAEEDRAKAYEMEGQKVEERWREAMRDGGRWIFRDE